MDKKRQLNYWKRLYNDWEKREEELGEALTGERLYIFDTLEYIEPAIFDLYSLDESDWNEELIYNYLSGYIDYDTFLEFAVGEDGTYDGLNMTAGGTSVCYWRTPYLAVVNEKRNISEVDRIDE